MTDRALAKKLLPLNQWAAPYFDDWEPLINSSRAGDFRSARAHFVRARRNATRMRLSTGVARWNVWAKEMLAIKNQFGNDPALITLWSLFAEADLTNERFSSTFDAATAIFPGALDLTGASFERDAWFNHVRFRGATSFKKALFGCEANFEGANFEETTTFAEVCFRKNAEFRNVVFQRAISFELANFVKDAWFRGSHFRGPTSFHRAQFGGEAGLGACHYSSNADFSDVCFRDNGGFDGSCFEAGVNFDDTQFVRNAWFSKAIFRGSATFERARFLGRMNFDGIEVVLPTAAPQLQELIRLATDRSAKARPDHLG